MVASKVVKMVAMTVKKLVVMRAEKRVAWTVEMLVVQLAVPRACERAAKLAVMSVDGMADCLVSL